MANGLQRETEFLSHYRQHENDLRAVIGSLVRDAHAREDLLQEVALVLWKKFDEYDGVHSFGAWARGIAVRKALQSFARNRRTPTPVSPDILESILTAYDETESENPEPTEREEALRHCLERLPEKSRRLIGLRYERALKLHEVAAEVGSTLDAVHKALSRIRDRLHDCVQKRLPEGR
ncbi:MAG: sigma-70 family RNA polymerase sigma factor [Kiritimatiellia bacterium]|nr:sigma-70 family RNA polymerase sigma factor [Kiritimatiellia bacterium]